MDYKKGRVSNYLILSGIITTCLIHIMNTGLQGFLFATLGMVFVLVIFFPLFKMKVFGGGDIKLFIIVASLGKFSILIHVIYISFVAGGIGSLFKMIRRRELFVRLKNLYQNVREMYFTGLKQYKNYAQDPKANGIPFAVAIFFGYVWVIILQRA